MFIDFDFFFFPFLQQQPAAVKDEWSDVSNGSNNQELLFVDDVISNKQSSTARKRGRPRKAETAHGQSDLDRDFVCHVCSETCFGFQLSVDHMNDKHRVGSEPSDKVSRQLRPVACFIDVTTVAL